VSSVASSASPVRAFSERRACLIFAQQQSYPQVLFAVTLHWPPVTLVNGAYLEFLNQHVSPPGPIPGTS
jgi:hypothetical protein